MKIADLVKIARLYAAIAVDLCNREKPSPGNPATAVSEELVAR
jgi:hypothetical protein